MDKEQKNVIFSIRVFTLRQGARGNLVSYREQVRQKDFRRNRNVNPLVYDCYMV